MVVAETASLELAYIIDRFHNGKLSFAVRVLRGVKGDQSSIKRRRFRLERRFISRFVNEGLPR